MKLQLSSASAACGFARHGVFACVVACLAACVAPDPRSTERIVPVRLPPVQSIEDQAREAANDSRPRKEHRALSPLAGRWKTTVVQVDASNGESDPHEGTASIEWVLGGRYLQWSTVLGIGGQDYATTGFLGFYVNESEYQLLIISDLATGMGVARGRGDLAERGIRLTLEVPDSSSGAIRRAQSVLRLVGPDHFVLEQLGIDPSGVERIVRRTHYRRFGPRP